MPTLSEGKAYSSGRKIIDFVRFTQVLATFSISYIFYHYHFSSVHFSWLNFYFEIFDWDDWLYINIILQSVKQKNWSLSSNSLSISTWSSVPQFICLNYPYSWSLLATLLPFPSSTFFPNIQISDPYVQYRVSGLDQWMVTAPWNQEKEKFTCQMLGGMEATIFLCGFCFGCYFTSYASM